MYTMTDAPELTEANCALLNGQFYDAQPWIYFQQRLAHLMFAASDGDGYRAIFANGVTAGGVTLKIDVDPAASDLPTPEQSFTAVETEVLLHHCAETLLRFVHAHAEASPCPWVRMAHLTSHRDFKSWVRTTITKAPDDDVAQLCGYIFASDPNSVEDRRSCVRYLRLLAEHFLDSDSYNAAKHGMALHGGSERLQVEVADWKLLERDGMRVSWLTRWPRDDVQRPPRWTQVNRLLDADATIALTYTATMLMRSIWVRGRQRHLGEPWDEVFRPVPPEQMFSDRGIRHHVLADTFRQLAISAEQQTFVVRSANFQAPPAGEASTIEGPIDTGPGPGP